MLQRAFVVLACVQVAAGLSTADLRRAVMKKPSASSGLLASSREGVFTTINEFMVKGGHRVAECETFTHEELDRVTRRVLEHSSPKLAEIYAKAGDARGFVNIDAIGTAGYNTTRDGKCAQALMVWAHHIPTEARELLNREGLTLPLMPKTGPRLTHDALYGNQSSCLACHNN
eukprot:TRINITY_DN16462_c0_g1_i1.p1 TRINITY_DN16462_c0_g1~~TRINITY_DN16462_c0_g1_i1.p1  ORF type:complete len:188 (+),score=62.31 TRINITY_DN16462_c0_g1_i1:48-566(+)